MALWSLLTKIQFLPIPFRRWRLRYLNTIHCLRGALLDEGMVSRGKYSLFSLWMHTHLMHQSYCPQPLSKSLSHRLSTLIPIVDPEETAESDSGMTIGENARKKRCRIDSSPSAFWISLGLGKHGISQRRFRNGRQPLRNGAWVRIGPSALSAKPRYCSSRPEQVYSSLFANDSSMCLCQLPSKLDGSSTNWHEGAETASKPQRSISVECCQWAGDICSKIYVYFKIHHFLMPIYNTKSRDTDEC